MYGPVIRCPTYIRKQVCGGDGDIHLKTPEIGVDGVENKCGRLFWDGRRGGRE